MSGLFTVPIGGLKPGHHSFEFEIGRGFFDKFEGSEINEGNLVAVVSLDKSSTHVELDIKIRGTVKICCDRCLEMFDFPVDSGNRIVVKFGPERDDSDPEILTIPPDEHVLDLMQYFYEFIYLALPIQRIHPDDKNGVSTCDPFMLQKLKEHLIDEEKEYGPRWDDLKKLMNDN